MSKEVKVVPANQTVLLKNAAKLLKFLSASDHDFLGDSKLSHYPQNKEYLEKTAFDLQNSEGFCHGLTILKARCIQISRASKEKKSEIVHDNHWFKSVRMLLAQWTPETHSSYSRAQIDDMLFFIQQINFGQNSEKYLPELDEYDLQRLMPVWSSTPDKIPEMSYQRSIRGFYQSDVLAKILTRCLRKDRLLFLSSGTHVGLLFLNDRGKIEFFDINDDQDDQEYDDLNQAIDHFAKFPHLRSDLRLPVKLTVLSASSLEKDFPSIQEIVAFCQDGEIPYSAEVEGYLGNKTSLQISSDEEQYRDYFLSLLAKKSSPLMSSMIEAAIDGDLVELKRLISSSVDLDKVDHFGQTMLIHAVQAKEKSFVEQLIAADTQLDIQDKFGWTALMYAVEKDNLELIAILLAADADLFIKNKGGNNTISLAMKKNDAVLIKALLDHHYPGEKTLLMQAVHRKDLETIQLLLTAKADVNAADEAGRTALFYAVLVGSLEIVNILLAAGANPMRGDRQGRTAEDDAVKFGHKEIAIRLDTAAIEWIQKPPKPATGLKENNTMQSSNSYMIFNSQSIHSSRVSEPATLFEY